MKLFYVEDKYTNFAYYASGNYCKFISAINSEAQKLADLIGVDVGKVLFDGRIIDSDWITGYYLFYVECPTYPGENFVKVKNRLEYIRRGYTN